MTPQPDGSVGDDELGAVRTEVSSAPIPISQGRKRASSPVELVERARTGDERSFELLYRSQFAGIARQVAALVRDPHRTEDVVAQTFLLAWRDLPKLRQAGRFDSWLARIAHNQAMSELRRRPTVPLEDAPDPENPSELDQPAAALDLSSNIEAVHAALIVRLVENTTASGAGVAIANVEPPVNMQAVPSFAIAHLDEPRCLMRSVPDQSQLGSIGPLLNIAGGSISAVQDLRP